MKDLKSNIAVGGYVEDGRNHPPVIHVVHAGEYVHPCAIATLADQTLAAVRELSENATLRPAPNALRTIPLQAFVIQPVPEWRRKWIRIQELAIRKS